MPGAYTLSTPSYRWEEKETIILDSTPWNEIIYDHLDRPIKQKFHTGKEVTTRYDGLRVTVSDGDKEDIEEMDGMGNRVYHKDPGGEIRYTYYANSKLKEAIYGNIAIKMEYDGWGRRTKLVDPSAGTYTYLYDDWGRKTKETSPKGETIYEYDTYGKLLRETSAGDSTDIRMRYRYDGKTPLLRSIEGTSGGDFFSYENEYDEYYRLVNKKETHPFFTKEERSSFDRYGRVDKVDVIANAGRLRHAKSVRSVYDTLVGIRIGLQDGESGASLWSITKMNAKEFIEEMSMGNGYSVSNTYNCYNMLGGIVQRKGDDTAIDMEYIFDEKKGLLVRRNNRLFRVDERFEYDALDRLTKENINDKEARAYEYDGQGRMTKNSAIGGYVYEDSSYRLKNINAYEQGMEALSLRRDIEINYNSYKKAVSIYAKDRERITLDYGIMRERYAMYYGGTEEDKTSRPMRKYYSADMGVEIKENVSEGTIEILTYLDGDPYSATVVSHVTFRGGNKEKEGLYYLHRDYQSTIVAISDERGALLEKRDFDAWGNLRSAWNDKNGQDSLLRYLDRGYTGHEHLQSIGLIQMNGRLFDPQLRRFLSPDNYVQDPGNTQSFNRYAYGMNNPLAYIDPSGEVAFFVPILIGIGISAAMKLTSNILSGAPWYQGLALTVITGALSGGVSFGIGAIATQILSATASPLLAGAFQAAAHGLSGGFMNVLANGGNWSAFGSGFLSGMVSSVISSGAGLIKGMDETLQTAAMIGAGGLSGGLSSAIAGGNFWDGMRQGLITSALNHAMHRTFGKENQPPKRKVIDNTKDAVNHYFDGNGEPVELGPNTIKKLLRTSRFIEKHNRIISDKTDETNGNFSVNMTEEVFHVGRTKVEYSVGCASGNCNVTYKLFVDDGFWDPNFIGEFFERFSDSFKPDGLGPNLELGGDPYRYIPSTIMYSFPNPGYK